MKKICFIATVPSALNSFMSGHISGAAKQWSVKLISNSAGSEILNHLDAEFIPCSMRRNPSMWSDLIVLFQLIFLFKRQGFDLIHSITPKAGLLSMLAGWIVNIPNRIHTFTGQVWMNKTGLNRYLLKQFDRLIVLFATHIFIDSPSQRDFLISEGVLPKDKGVVIGSGSVCGVDSARFYPNAAIRHSVRNELKIQADAVVVIFIGRMNFDKGVLDLIAAFNKIFAIRSNVFLLLVGPEDNLTYDQLKDACSNRSQLRIVNFTSNPERFLAASDIFCLPSYREGFGQVVIEAAATELPTVASRIYGITDAVDDGKTGILFTPKNIEQLSDALVSLIDDRDVSKKLGKTGRKRVIKFFSNQKITDQLMAFYAKILV